MSRSIQIGNAVSLPPLWQALLALVLEILAEDPLPYPHPLLLLLSKQLAGHLEAAVQNVA